jgi:hypothetical protein
MLQPLGSSFSRPEPDFPAGHAGLAGPSQTALRTAAVSPWHISGIREHQGLSKVDLLDAGSNHEPIRPEGSSLSMIIAPRGRVPLLARGPQGPEGASRRLHASRAPRTSRPESGTSQLHAAEPFFTGLAFRPVGLGGGTALHRPPPSPGAACGGSSSSHPGSGAAPAGAVRVALRPPTRGSPTRPAEPGPSELRWARAPGSLGGSLRPGAGSREARPPLAIQDPAGDP